MKKRRLLPGLILTSILGALVLSVYASIKPCTEYWNDCQGRCGGSPSIVVYPTGMQKVRCDSSHSPCEAGTWYSAYCEDN